MVHYNRLWREWTAGQYASMRASKDRSDPFASHTTGRDVEYFSACIVTDVTLQIHSPSGSDKGVADRENLDDPSKKLERTIVQAASKMAAA